MEAWLEKSERRMKVRRMALRTVDTYLGWQGRYLRWVKEQALEPASQAGVGGLGTSVHILSIERETKRKNAERRAQRIMPG